MKRVVYLEAAMTQSVTDRMFDYWRSLMRDGRVPSRIDVNPSHIKSILPSVFILEFSERAERPPGFSDEKDITFRLVGSDICDLHMRNLAKTSVKDMFLPVDRTRAENELRRVFEHQEARILRSRVRSRFAIADMETIILPLENGEEGVTRAIGSQIPLLDRNSLWWKGAHPVSAHEFISSENLAWRSANVIGDPRLQPPAYETPVFDITRRARRPEGRKVGHLIVIEGGSA